RSRLQFQRIIAEAMEKGDRRNFRDANWLILRCRAWRKWSKTCLAVIPSVPFFLLLAGAAAADGPLPYTRKSIARGKQFYLVNCVECHDQDGKGLNRRDFTSTVPADLTDPEAWLHGASAEAIFASIHDGTKQDMPP